MALLNRNQLTDIIPNLKVVGEAILLSVIILQLNFPNFQNLLTCQCLGKASTSAAMLVGIFNPFECDTSDASCDTQHCLSCNQTIF